MERSTVMRKVDKGSHVTVWCRDGYVEEPHKHLKDKTVYKGANFKEIFFSELIVKSKRGFKNFYAR